MRLADSERAIDPRDRQIQKELVTQETHLLYVHADIVRRRGALADYERYICVVRVVVVVTHTSLLHLRGDSRQLVPPAPVLDASGQTMHLLERAMHPLITNTRLTSLYNTS